MKKITLIFLMMLLSFASYAQLPEGFEGTSIPTSGDWVLPSGTWKVFDNGIGLAQSWSVIPSPNACVGTRSAYLNRENVTDGTFAQDWLVMPQTTIPNNGQLRFLSRLTQAGNQGSIYTIRVSTTSQTNAASFTTIQTWTETEINAVFNDCEEKVVQFPATYVGQAVFVAFVMTNDNGDRWIIDEVNIVEQCLDPTTQTATNPTLTGATLGWTNPGGAPQSEVEIVATGATPTGTGVIATGINTHQATGLTQGTCYDFYVRALCASGTQSEWVGPFNFCTVSLGETCGAPISISSLPYTTTDNTSGYGDDYSGSPGSSGCGTTGTYLNGDDVFYSFTATTANSVTITSLTNSTWSGLFVYNSCTNIGVSCVAGSTAGNGTTIPDSVTFTPTIGQTYYIVISTWAAPQSVPYTLTIVENTCTNMTATFAVVSNCASTANPNTFFVTANVTNMGSATSIVGTTNPVSTTQTITAAGTMQFGPFPNNTNVTVNLQNAQDANCFRNSTVLTQAFCPATNNLCSGAIPVTCGSTVTQTTVGATTAGAPTTACGTTAGSGGLWYSFTGTGDITTFSLCGSAYDTKIQIYTGSCGAFTCVTGNDDFCGLQSQVQVVTVPGTLYYVYVFGFGTAQGNFTLNTTCMAPPTPPANDNCDTATNVPVNTNTNCTLVTPGTVVGATPSSQANGCVGTADDDVWFSFTATHTTHTINLLNITGSTLDLNHAIYSSTNTTNPCGNLTQLVCSNPDTSTVTGLTIGQVYFIRVYTAVATALQTTTFNVCVTPPPNYCNGDHFYDSGGAAGDYANNENTTTTICPTNPGDVVVVIFNTFNLENNFDFLRIYDGSTTAAPLLGVYTNNTALPPQFISTATNGCLTFNFTSDGSVVRPGWDATILCVPPPACPQPNGLTVTSTTSTGATLAWNETGTATNWNIVVQPAGTGYPTSTSTIIPTTTNPFSVTGLNSSTQYEFFVQADCGSPDGVSFWSGPRTFNTLFAGCNGNAAAGDACVTATPICNLNGYCGNTSATYSDASWAQLDTAFCGSIENNSFLTFIASATSISFQVNVANCANNNGIQMMIFSAATCGSGPVTSLTCWSPGNVPTGPATVSATGLVAGNTYYLMIDGFAGDVCDYSITAPGGGVINSVDITPSSATVCLGNSINLVASGGNGTFTWSPATGLNTTSGANVTFTPTAVGTYVITADSSDPNTACSSTDTTTITVVDQTTPTFNPIGSLCIGDSFTLPTTSIEGFTGTWSPAIDNTTTTTYTFTPGANQCATTTTMEVIISSSLMPTFAAIPDICTLDTPPVLSTSSDNGIVGTWSPATINTSIIGVTTYTFTPNASCANIFTLDVTIIDSVLPAFNQIPNVCQDFPAPTLETSSNQGITGTWNPSTIDTSIVGTVTYTFTPDSGQCAVNSTMDITIDAPSTTVSFTQIPNVCQDFPAPTLPATSNEGVAGTWSPSTIDTSVVGTVTYGFTPNGGQCAIGGTMDITIDAPSIMPIFTQIPNICLDLQAPLLPSTSNNGISGTWNPSTIDSSVVGTVTYTFTPNAAQCANPTTMDVTIDAPSITITFTQIPNVCQGLPAPSLPTSSIEGVSGTWNPSTIDTSVVGTVTYGFTPNGGQCAVGNTMDITIDAPSIVPTFTLVSSVCQNSTAPVLPLTSTNGITGTWSPSVVNTSVSGVVTYNFTPAAAQCAVMPPAVTIEVTPTPVASVISGSSVCKGSLYTFPALSSGMYYSGSSGTGTMYSSGDQLMINSTQTFYVYAQSGTTPNCTSETSFTVTAVDIPVVTLAGGCINNVYTITATVTTGETVTYQWSNSSGEISGATSSTLTVSQDGMYSCQVTSSGQLCESESVAFAANGTVCTIQKGISPNNDGLNDNFDLTGLNVKKLEIFNRYGKKVFTFSNYTNQWYGQSDSGNELPTGTYYFVIERDKVSTETGWIYINR